VYGWLAIVLGWWMARRLGVGAGALPAAIAVWLGTPLFFYMYLAPPMSHGCSAFAVAAFLATWLAVREHWSPAGCALLGALGALMAMVREQDVFVAAAPALDFLLAFTRSTRSRMTDVSRARLLAGAAAGTLAFAVCYVPQLLCYLQLNGSPTPSRLVARKMNWISPHALGVLASPRHGLLAWTPLVLLALTGLVSALRGGGIMSDDATDRRRRFAPVVAAALLVAVGCQIYVAGSVESWTVAGAFGQRRFVGLSAAWIVGLAVVWQKAWPTSHWLWRTAGAAGRLGWARPVPRAIVTALVVIGVWWNVGLMVQFGSGLMDRQRLELGRNAYHTFVTVPLRAPGLAWRYLFARSSFFARPAP
jgi:hypothetical protein